MSENGEQYSTPLNDEEQAQFTGAFGADAANVFGWSPDTTNTYKDSTTVDADTAQGCIDDWVAAIETFAGAVPKAAPVYTNLNDAELDRGFSQSFDDNNKLLVAVMNQSLRTIKDALSNLLQQDLTIGDGIPAPTPPGGSSGDSGGGGDSSSDSGENSPGTPALINNASEQLAAYKLISMSNLDGISDELTRLASTENKTLDELLSDSSYKDKIRNLLLNSQHIPDNLKELIKAGEFSISQNILKRIFDGKETEIAGLDDNTVITMRTYLTNVAASNNTTLTALLENSSNSRVLKSALNDFKKVSTYINSLNESEIAAAFTKIHDGDGIANVDSSVLSIIRTYVDTVAQNNNTSTEALISSGDIVSTIQNLGRSSVFASSLSHYSDSAIGAILNEKFG